MAHYRRSALEVWRGLDTELRYQSLGLADPESRPALEELEEAIVEPWCELFMPHRRRDESSAVVARLGGFRGWGGPFSSPPRVGAAGDRLYAFDNDACFSIHADCFGATLQKHRSDRPEGLSDDEENGVDAFDKRAWRAFRDQQPALADTSSVAANATTLVLTVAHSHKIYVAAL